MADGNNERQAREKRHGLGAKGPQRWRLSTASPSTPPPSGQTWGQVNGILEILFCGALPFRGVVDSTYGLHKMSSSHSFKITKLPARFALKLASEGGRGIYV